MSQRLLGWIIFLTLALAFFVWRAKENKRMFDDGQGVEERQNTLRMLERYQQRTRATTRLME